MLRQKCSLKRTFKLAKNKEKKPKSKEKLQPKLKAYESLVFCRKYWYIMKSIKMSHVQFFFFFVVVVVESFKVP